MLHTKNDILKNTHNFKYSNYPPYIRVGVIAQLVQYWTNNPEAAGSNPTGGKNFFSFIFSFIWFDTWIYIVLKIYIY